MTERVGRPVPNALVPLAIAFAGWLGVLLFDPGGPGGWIAPPVIGLACAVVGHTLVTGVLGAIAVAVGIVAGYVVALATGLLPFAGEGIVVAVAVVLTLATGGYGVGTMAIRRMRMEN